MKERKGTFRDGATGEPSTSQAWDPGLLLPGSQVLNPGPRTQTDAAAPTVWPNGQLEKQVGRTPHSWTESEIQEQLRRYNSGEDKPPWTGAVPDMSKLAARSQMDVMGFWWGWRMAAIGYSKCDICIYEAGYFYLGVYYCRPHWDLMV